ncbi:MAG: hypothetical protein NWE95_07205 [Candidatus Bathyarchaeota archaeon]|nr:hypothetical protein [Candidatus Bathyarchaeota archaeon]
MDAVKFHAANESFSHRVAKLVICNLLTEAGHHFKTEQPINEAVCDVIDLDTFVIYEIESHANSTIIKRKLDDFLHPLIEDLIVVDLRKMDIDWEPIFMLRDKIRKFCAL